MGFQIFGTAHLTAPPVPEPNPTAADGTSELAWLGLSGAFGVLVDLIHDPVWTDDE